MLYPYRPNAVKNRQRFNFGVLYPTSYSREHEGDSSALLSECVVQGNEMTRIELNVRFLRLAARTVSKVVPPSPTPVTANDPRLRQVERVDVDGRVLHTWQEAVDCSVSAAANVGELLHGTIRTPFSFDEDVAVEQVRDATGMTAAVSVKRTRSSNGEFILSARLVDGFIIVRLVVENHTTTPDPARELRDEALLAAFVSTHAIVTLRDGAFVSLLDPPDEAREAARNCTQIGAWPVLVGDPGATDAVLVSPIIVYDYPTLAPESPGDFFDATEMDEMLSLRILTLTDEEKLEMASADDRSRALLERTQALAADQMMKLHGIMRPVPQGEERAE